MSIPVRHSLDLGLNQLLSTLIENLTADPGTATAGRIIFRTDTGELKVGTGSAWVTFYRSTVRLDQITSPTAAVSLNSQRITSLATPTAASDAATKGYVDAAIEGLSPKDSARAATTGNIVLSALQTVDTVSLNAGDRVLVKNQTTASENGIYVAGTGAWARTADADSAGDLQGAYIFVDEGSQAGTSYVQTTDNITLGTSSITFVQFGASSAYTAGAGLTLTGNDFSVNVDGTTLEINADTLRVKAGGISASHLADNSVLLDDSDGTITGTLAIGNGGTGATTAAAARTALGAVTKFAATITGTGAATTFAVAHNLNTSDVQVQVYDTTTLDLVWTEVVRTDANTVTIGINPAPANGKTYRVIVVA